MAHKGTSYLVWLLCLLVVFLGGVRVVQDGQVLSNIPTTPESTETHQISEKNLRKQQINLEIEPANVNIQRHAIPFGDTDALINNFTLQHAVTPDVWNDYLCKGGKLRRLMRMSIEDATNTMGRSSESGFQKYEDLTQPGGGWRGYDKHEQYNLDNLGIPEVFSAVGASPVSGSILDPAAPNKVIAWIQDDYFDVNGVTVSPTEAQFYNTYNVHDGLLCAWSNYGPAYQTRKQTNPVLPNLKQWSDVVFLEWQNQAGGTGGTIPAPKNVLRISILNTDTLNLIDQVMRNLPDTERPPGPASWGVRLPPWPGKTFSINSDAGKVLLASPNGRGTAWFLIQHKEKFGVKWIDQITIFKDRLATYMLFRIADVQGGVDDD